MYRLRRYGKNWYVAWTEGGKPHRVSTRSDREDQAAIFRDQFIALRENPGPPDNILVRDILDGYQKASTSRVQSRGTLVYSIKPLLVQIGNIAPHQVSDALVARYAEKRDKAPGTILRELGVLRTALHWAERVEWIKKAPKFRMPVSTPESRKLWATKEQAQTLIDGCLSWHIRVFAEVGFGTGARKSAILGLTFDMIGENIDFGTGFGNKRRAIVPVTKRLREILDRQKGFSVGGFVVEHNGKPVKNIKHGFRDAATRVGLEWITPHVMRHSFATWAVMEMTGGDKYDKIGRMLGDTAKTVRDIYGHHSPDYLADVIKAVEF